MACDTGILYQGPIKAQAVLFLIQDPVEVLKKAEKKKMTQVPWLLVPLLGPE